LTWNIVGIIFFVLFGTPILGIIVVIELASVLNCKLSASGPIECLYLGIDFGERLYAYTIPFVGSIFSPIAFVLGFWDFIIAWFSIYILIKLVIRKNKI
jgi:hypothetical protein